MLPTPVTRGRRLRALETESFAFTETSHPRGMLLGRHAHERACINFVLAGVYDERVPGISEHHGPMGLVFKPAQAEHANRFEHAGARCLLVEILAADRADPALDLSSPAEIRDPRAAMTALALWSELASPDDCSALAIDEIALELCGLVLGSREDRALERRSPRVRAVTELLHDDPSRSWTLSKLAREVALHPSHLARAFRARHGTTIGRYLRCLRLAEAARRLALSDEPISELAVALGFADQSHLTHSFRAALRTTPAAFRRALRSAGAARNSPR